MDEPVIVVLGTCLICGRPFSFNPHRVPSFPIHKDDPSSREPICPTCIVQINELRREKGRPEWPVYDDSYEPISPAELLE